MYFAKFERHAKRITDADKHYHTHSVTVTATDSSTVCMNSTYKSAQKWHKIAENVRCFILVYLFSTHAHTHTDTASETITVAINSVD